MDVRFLQSGVLDLIDNKGNSLDKTVRAGCIYPVVKVVMSHDKKEADIYFKEGVAEEVSTQVFELHGRPYSSEGEQFLFYKSKEEE